MNPWIELQRQASGLDTWQLLLVLVFVLGYVSSIGNLFEARGRRRAALMALLAGVSLCLLVAPWVLGALMLAAAIGAVGVFTGLAVLLSRLLGVDQRLAPLPALPTDDAREPARRSGARPTTAGPLTVT